MSTTQFRKPPTTIAEQIVLLQDRGLIIKDISEVEHYLTYAGYYRLAGYWQIYQSDREKHIFHEGTTFKHIKELYHMDMELRQILFDLLGKIEVGLRTIIFDTMCHSHGSFWYADPALANKQDRFDDNIKTINDEFYRADEDFVGHFQNRYNNPYPPAWYTAQVLSFGCLSRIYNNINNSLPEKKAIAKAVGLPNHLWLEAWLYTFSVLRNYCAHHSRVCYRTFAYPPKDLRTAPLPWLSKLPEAGGRVRERFYYQLCAVKYMLHTIDARNNLTINLKELLNKYQSVSLRWMGFPADWENEDLWK